MSRTPSLVWAVLLAILIIGCGSPAVSPRPAASVPSPSVVAGIARTQQSEGGQVTVEVTWAGLAAGAEFHVTMDTHAVDLDPLNLADATLRNDRGEMLTARPWAAPKGGHHRQGYLSFGGDAPAFFENATWVELGLVGVGDLPERTLRWEVGS